MKKVGRELGWKWIKGEKIGSRKKVSKSGDNTSHH